MSQDWKAYFERIGDRPPRETLLRALKSFDAEGRRPAECLAIDLGCGHGRDAVELLRRGWRVLAIDADRDALDALDARLDFVSRQGLRTHCGRFESVLLPPADLVNSSFALPLCPPPAFRKLWPRILIALRPGGRFCGQLYGDRDDWAGDSSLTTLTRAQAEALLRAYEVEEFREEEDDAVTPRGRPKHWHIFHIVARRPG